MKKSLLGILFVFFVTNLFPSPPHDKGTNVRGQVKICINLDQQTVPFINVPVQLYLKDHKKFKLQQETTTDQLGFFNFDRLKPEEDYYIKVNKKKNFKIDVIKIDEKADNIQDLPVLLYNACDSLHLKQ